MKNPPNPESTKLFKTYAANAPVGTWPTNTSTHQGLYCLTADGAYLSGKFANPNNAVARAMLLEGLEKWKKGAPEAKPVPTNRLDLYGGKPLEKGGIKLEVVYRDFPRGDVKRPGTARFPNPYNLGWWDFSAEEAKAFLAKPDQPAKLPADLFAKFARTTLKDAVRGQMSDWKPEDLKGGSLASEFIEKNGTESLYRITGSASFASGAHTYEPAFHGLLKFDSANGEFTKFQLIAAGQRTGRGPANGRETDLGPAPMGVGFQLYQ